MGSTYTVDHSIQAAALYMTGVYQIQNYEVTALGVSTNKTTHGSLRGIGKADASYILERLVDIAARELKLDPIEIRMKNFIPAEAFPYRNVTGALYDSGQYHLAMKRTAEMAGYEQLRKEQAELRKQGIYRGIGVALVMEPTSSSRIHATGGYASCRLRIDPTGAATVFSSMGEQGQGHETTIAQIVASQTGIPFDKITVIHGDTLPTPYGFGTGSSRSSVVLMPSAWVAGKLMRDKIARHRRAAIEYRAGKTRNRRRQSVRERKFRAVDRGHGNCPHRLRRDSFIAGKHGARSGSHRLFHQSQYRLRAGRQGAHEYFFQLSLCGGDRGGRRGYRNRHDQDRQLLHRARLRQHDQSADRRHPTAGLDHAGHRRGAL